MLTLPELLHLQNSLYNNQNVISCCPLNQVKTKYPLICHASYTSDWCKEISEQQINIFDKMKKIIKQMQFKNKEQYQQSYCCGVFEEITVQEVSSQSNKSSESLEKNK